MKKIIITLILIIIATVLIYMSNFKRPIAVIGAMDCEIEEIAKGLKNPQTIHTHKFKVIKGKLGNEKIVLIQCGVGKANAAMVTQFIIDKYNPKYIINTGIIGALTKEHSLGDIFLIEKMIQHDFDITAFGYPRGYVSGSPNKKEPTPFSTDEQLTDKIKKILLENNPNQKIYSGTTVTGDKFISDENEKIYLNKTYNAKTVDMESAAIAQTADKNDIPIVCIKTISDTFSHTGKEYSFNEEEYAKKSAKTIINIIR